MYILVKKQGDFVISDNKNYILPHLWSTDLSYDDKEETANMLFPTKQLAYLLKHYNALGDEWEVMPAQAFIEFYMKLDDELVKIPYSKTRFAVIVGYRPNEGCAVDRKIISVPEICSDYDWLGNLVKRYGVNLATAVNQDKKLDYKEAEKLGKGLATEMKKLENK